MSARIEIPRQALKAFCRRWRVTELALFGSVTREDFGADSDIDILVTFDPATEWGFAQLAEMQQELENLWGRRVDLVKNGDPPALLGRHAKFDSNGNLIVTPKCEPPSTTQRRNHETSRQFKSLTLGV